MPTRNISYLVSVGQRMIQVLFTQIPTNEIVITMSFHSQFYKPFVFDVGMCQSGKIGKHIGIIAAFSCTLANHINIHKSLRLVAHFEIGFSGP
jgi:hypothetical protein